MNKNIFKKFIVIVELIFVLFGYNISFAEDISTDPLVSVIPIVLPEAPVILTKNIHLKIISGTNSLYDNNIEVKPCDSDNNVDTPDKLTAYCGITQSGVSSDWDWKWAPGAFVNSINGIAGYTSKDKSGNDVYHYWSWSSNGNLGMTGLNEYEIQTNDTILLEFIDPKEEFIPIIPEVSTLPSNTITTTSSSGGYVMPTKEKEFSVSKAFEFLLNNQKSDFSFGSYMYTDWVAVAVGAGDNQSIKIKLIEYFKTHPLVSEVLTDNERHAMALMALNINPYNGAEINYIKKIVDTFDGISLGEKDLVNDDIFGLIVLKNAGYDYKDEIIKKEIDYILFKQSKDGSWGSVDMTASAIEALKGFEDVEGVKESILKGESFIISKQGIDGGFGNSFSASWVLQTIFENKDILKTEKYLVSKQGNDGGVDDKLSDDIDTRIWMTSYVIPAILHKPWNIILNKFTKPIIKDNITIEKKKSIKKYK